MKKNIVTMIGIIIVAIIAISIYTNTNSQGKSADHPEMNITEQKQQVTYTQEGIEQKEDSSVSQGDTAAQNPDSASQNGQSLNNMETEQETLSGEGITVIGDSVLVGVEPYLKEALPGIYVDGKVSRQMSQGETIVKELKSQGKLGDRIIIHLGTNGPFSKKQLQSLLESLSDAKIVVLINTRVPKGWQDTVNTNIKEVAKQFSNVKVVDWYSASQGKDQYFYQDGVHLKSEGNKYFASLIVDALKE
ncbi:MAG: hypothetical protein ACQEXX_24300 [Bacillota bacterium]